MKKHLLFGLVLFFFPLLTYAQLFRAGIVAGINFSQIDGDNLAGYTKAGFNGGFMAQMDLTDRWYLSFELLYNQKGSGTALKPNSTRVGNQIRFLIDYADIPIMVKYHDVKGGLIFGGGLAVGRLIRRKYIVNGLDLTNTAFNPPNEDVRDWDLNLVLEGSYMFTPIWGVNVRYQYSMIPFRKDPLSKFRRNGQFHHLVSLRTIFLFSALFDPEAR